MAVGKYFGWALGAAGFVVVAGSFGYSAFEEVQESLGYKEERPYMERVGSNFYGGTVGFVKGIASGGCDDAGCGDFDSESAGRATRDFTERAVTESGKFLNGFAGGESTSSTTETLTGVDEFDRSQCGVDGGNVTIKNYRDENGHYPREYIYDHLREQCGDEDTLPAFDPG